MGVEIEEFGARSCAIDGVVVVDVKRVTDERGTIHELFRRSAFSSAGIELAPFDQINLTRSARGVVRGMHAERMTKLVTVAAGRAVGAYVDLRPHSSTFGVVERVELRPGIQVLVPAGVANGFQSLTDDCLYVYCFDAEWMPGMAGTACTPLDPELGIEWPIPVDPDDPTRISAKDRTAPTLAAIRAELGAAR